MDLTQADDERAGLTESPDAASPDAAGSTGDLSPRVPRAGRAAGKRRNWGAIALLIVVFCGAGLVLTKFLTSAIDYYCNVDEIGQKAGCESDRRLRIQGTVDEGSIRNEDGITYFSMSFNNVSLPVRYQGDPGGIFEACIPVVVHGELVDGTFRGDRVEVKHSEEYEAKNPDRVDGTEASACG